MPEVTRLEVMPAEHAEKDRQRVARLESALDGLMRGQAARNAIAEAAGDPKSLEELKANPKAYLVGKGISLPEEVEAEYEEGSHCLYFYYDKIYRKCYCYETRAYA